LFFSFLRGLGCGLTFLVFLFALEESEVLSFDDLGQRLYPLSPNKEAGDFGLLKNWTAIAR
jgi:hypothetical protein